MEQMQMLPKKTWSNSSVMAFAAGADPIQKMLHTASAVALDALQAGWGGPPFDPFQLAERLKIMVVPREDVVDARTVPTGAGRIQIEYNPNRPKQRVRYSVAHEIAHSFFPDCAERVRNRSARDRTGPTDWELEMLCNIGAAEILMPSGAFRDLKEKRLTIEDLMIHRKSYEVSTESIALKFIKITDQPAAIFVASRRLDAPAERYRLDYAVGSRTWPVKLPTGLLLPKATIVGGCSAIGFTAKGQEEWTTQLGAMYVESVGIPPYPGSPHPRAVGLLTPLTPTATPAATVRIVKGDATQPRGSDVRILAHVVNDKTPNWGAGFGRIVRETWPPVQEDFRRWVSQDSSRLSLGNYFISKVSDDMFVVPMICQHGYGESEKPRIRYAALKSCLEGVAQEAVSLNASVHMPRIGTGYGGGSWGLIEPIIDETVCRSGVEVTIYELPGQKTNHVQRGLFDG